MMAASNDQTDVNELFQRMGEKLGWFKHKHMGDALKTLSKSTKKKSSSTGLKKDSNNVDKENAVVLKKKKKNRVVAEKPARVVLGASSALSNVTPSFDGVLSSDSDSSFSLAPEQLVKPVSKRDNTVTNSKRDTTVAKKAFVLDSDSDEEEVEKEDTYVSCVGESLMESHVNKESSKEEADDASETGPKNPNRISLAMNDSIVTKYRLSVGSMTLSSDMDSFGDPLLESTRIHRQSSIGYRQLFDDIEESEEGDESKGRDKVGEAGTDVPSPIKDKMQAKDLNVDENDICNDITKLGIDDNNFKSNKSNLNNQPDLTCNETHFVSALEVMADTEASTLSNEKSYRSRSSSNSSVADYEEIEVIDAAVQTEDIFHVDSVMDDHLLCKTAQFIPKKDAYKEETMIDNVVLPEIHKNCNAYDHTTLVSNGSLVTPNTSSSRIYEQTQIKEVIGCVSINSSSQKSEIVNNYSQITVNQSEICSASSQPAYEQETVNLEEGNSVDINIISEERPEQETETFEDIGNHTADTTAEESQNQAYKISTQEIQCVAESSDSCKSDISVDKMEESSSSESVYEVRDVATQTETSDVENITSEVGEEKNQVSGKNEESSDIDELTEQVVDDKENKSSDSVQTTSVNESVNSLDNSAEIVSENDSEGEGKEHDRDKEQLDSSDHRNGSIAVLSSGSVEIAIAENADSESESDADVNKHGEMFEQSTEARVDTGNSSDSDSNGGRRDTRPSKAAPRHDSSQLSTGTQSWRDSKRYDSSSSDDNLEDFFQKLRGPKKSRISSSESEEERPRPMSMTDFIVEDGEVSSGSEDDAFYLRETNQQEAEAEVKRLRNQKVLTTVSPLVSDDDDNGVFSSKLYPTSVTKHKKTKKKPASWSFSSDSDGADDVFKSCSTNRKKSTDSKKTNRQPPTRKEKPVSKANFDFSNSESDADDIENPLPSQENTSDKASKSVSCNSNDVLASSGNHRNSDGDNALSEVIPYISSTVTIPQSNNKAKGKNPCVDISDSDSEVTSPVLFKTPNPLRKTGKTQNSTVFKTPKSRFLSSLLSDDEEEEGSYELVPSISTSSADNSGGSSINSPSENLFTVPTPVGKGKARPLLATPKTPGSTFTYSFMKSLSDAVDNNRRDPKAARFVAGFKKLREELTQHLFKMYNETVFENKLPQDLQITWNKRLLRTAGFCAYKKHKNKEGERSARIELSTKVCDSTERVRDTLIHELCHAAVWLLNDVNGGHGPYWKFWARHSNRVHPELPAIGRCHSYSINTKFTYRCVQCGYSIGRHSKSLDTEKKVCGHCHGRFELIQNPTPTTPRSAASSAASTPRTPNRFAMFVKENYQNVKKDNKDLTHGDVMKQLSKLFADSKIAS